MVRRKITDGLHWGEYYERKKLKFAKEEKGEIRNG